MFLYGEQSENIYMCQPPSFIDPNYPSYVCKINKAIYNLKQSLRLWFATLSSHMQQLGFFQRKVDPALHVYQQNGTTIYFLVYVNSILISGNNPTIVIKIIDNIKCCFKMKYIHATKNDNSLKLTQAHYANDILRRAEMQTWQALPTSTSSKTTPKAEDILPYNNPIHYHQLIGVL